MSKLISLFDVGPLIHILERGDLVLTPNQRLASRIRAAYAIHCRKIGNRVVNAPAVYSLNGWIEICWENLLLKASPCVLGHKLLNTAQEQVLWEHVVESSPLGTALLRPTATAQQAISAYRTMVEWRQDFSDHSIRALFKSNEDSSVFLAWVDKFEKRCSEHHWLPRSRQPESLIQAFEQGELDQFDDIIGIGFDDITPLHHALISSAGTFKPIEFGDLANSVRVVGCENTSEQLLVAAVWAKKTLRDQPDAAIALVIPDLTQQRQTVQRVLQEVFEPEFNRPGVTRRNLPFNLSAGSALLEAPVISAAIDGLSVCMRSLELETLIALCQSPFYCLRTSDSDAVCQLVTLLYNERDYSISSARFRQLASKIGATQSESWHFANALQEQANRARSASIGKSRTPTQWLPVIQQLLEALEWPGARRLDSIEYQQVSQWQLVLEQFASLDPIVKSISFTKAIGYIRGILSRQIFQPQTADSSLQVLGTLEAAGLQFTHIWLMSMSSHQWPPQAAPNALLPFQLQREQKMPHASAERELEYAKRLTQRFIHSAQTVVVSYPTLVDENPNEVSALFDQYDQATVVELTGRKLKAIVPLREIRQRNLESVLLEPYKQGSAPNLLADEYIKGGSQLFANQSACPFRAFVSHRLGLQPLPQPELGLNAADRGSLLHRALELVWEKLKSQKSLNEQTEQALQKLCLEAAEYSLVELAQRRGSSIGARYSKLESTRLQNLLLAWLSIEKQRAPFVVEGIESRKTFRFAELELETRIDRIDKLADGSLLIIDYKTGKSSINRWWGERPDEPQLPLYSLLTDNILHTDDTPIETDLDESHVSDNSVGAIAFAQIRIDGCGLKGVGSEHLPEEFVRWQDKVKTDAGVENWHQLKQYWQKVLNALAGDFIAGKSTIDPKQRPQTCQYCNFASVCRVNHQNLNY